jgi:arabinose-5-phosphate isomerase
MERRDDFLFLPVGEVMTRSPKTIGPETLAGAAVHLMETYGIMALPVVSDSGELRGVVHLHDLLRGGVI